MNIIDRTASTASIHQTRNGRHIFSRGNPSARRNVGMINGIILHQTAFVSNDRARMDYVIANFVVMRDGSVLKIRDMEVALNSIATNQRAIDIEFVGNYPSERVLRRSSQPDAPPVVQLRAGRDLVDYLRGRHGVTNIFAHAQFTPKNCPGPQLWYNVGEWAVRQGLRSNGRGRPVPRAWQDEALAAPGLL